VDGSYEYYVKGSREDEIVATQNCVPALFEETENYEKFY
jgi:hypothetical protein